MNSEDQTLGNGPEDGAKRDGSKRQPPLNLEALIEAVRELTVEEGDVPPERAVAERLNVKRYQVRRALETLRANGELPAPRVGRRANAESKREENLVRSTNPLEVMEMRLVLEPALARLAALRASPADISRIVSAATTPAGMSPSQADQIFHRAIASGAGNMLASELHQLLNQVATDGRLRYADSDKATTLARVESRDAEHHRIAQAIAARDPVEAERAMWDHLAVVQRKIMARLSPGMDAA
ncbi:FadR/GntR family transcriptional regulator [Rhodospirillum sp. A1_3_36]|uniref:FadR/GntR family transcriptional regulator n=1 Tax=Rhodospirillum sp. A1_3_36 TaxID=3391666 RepID=UPI0039A5FFF8